MEGGHDFCVCVCVFCRPFKAAYKKACRMCHSLDSVAGAAGLGLHPDFRAGSKHVWSDSETKQYPLLDDTEIACVNRGHD